MKRGELTFWSLILPDDTFITKSEAFMAVVKTLQKKLRTAI